MREPLPYPEVAVYYCYEVTAMLVSGIYLAAYLYAYSHDPWLTPRHTPYMILWWKIGGAMFDLFFLLVAVGIVMLAASSRLRRCWTIWCTLALMIAISSVIGRP